MPTITTAQDDRMAALGITADPHDPGSYVDSDGARVYVEHTKGQTIISQLRRYLDTGDSQQINTALWTFLQLACAFIAHTDLDGFRHTYRSRVDFIDVFMCGFDNVGGAGDLHVAWQACQEDKQAFDPADYQHPYQRRVSKVYGDGMTDVEIKDAVRLLVFHACMPVAQAADAATRAAEMHQLRDLADKYGYTLTPAR